MSRILDPPCRWAATAGSALQVLGLLAAMSGCLGAAPSSLAARRSEVELRHDAKSLRLALEDLQHHFGTAYPGGPSFLARLAALEPALETGDGSAAANFDALRQEALLANPLLRSNHLLCVLSGYHGPHRMGQLVILDTAKGWQEAEGIVQRISGRGDPIKPMVKDNLV